MEYDEGLLFQHLMPDYLFYVFSTPSKTCEISTRDSLICDFQGKCLISNNISLEENQLVTIYFCWICDGTNTVTKNMNLSIWIILSPNSSNAMGDAMD